MQPGAVISHYRIIERLGGGGMGLVYLAEDLLLERRVALKFLPSHLGTEDSAVRRFRQEAVAASALDHPNICTIYEIGQAEAEPEGGSPGLFIAMAYYEGKTLRQMLDERGQPFTLEEGITVASQVADGLGAAHAKGVIHRDVKPENILVTTSGRIVVLDFGIAKLAGATQLTAENATPGTVAYMAPEQTRGETVDHRTDVWALGIVVFEMLAGRRPFAGDYEQAIIYSILNEEPADLDAVDERVRPLLSRALSKDPAVRFDSVTDFADSLARAAGVAEADARDSRPARRRPAVILAAAAILALVASVVVWLSYGPGRDVSGIAPGEISAGTVSFSQLTTASELEEFPALSPDGREIVFSREVDGYRRLFIRNLDSGEERQLTEEPSDDIQAGWSPDGRSIVFVRASVASGKIEPGDIYGVYTGGDIWKLELQSGRTRRLVEQAFNPAFSPDGEQLVFDAVWAGTSQRLWMSDREGRNPSQLTSDVSEDTDHIRPRWSPDGRLIVFQNQRRTKLDIEVLDVASREVRMVTDDAHQNVNPVFAGERGVAFSSDRSGGMNIWYVPLSETGMPASAPRQISTGAGSDVHISASPDGTKLVYSVLGINADLWTLPLDPASGRATGEPHELISTTREESRGSWSSDDAMIAFNSDRSGEMNIWLYSLADGSSRQLTHGPGGDYQPLWSPDDSTLVFFSARDGSPDIWTVDIATAELTQLTSQASVEVNPCFSPDGKQIAFLSDRGGRREVWVMNSDGAEQRRLTAVGAGGHFLRWTPDSERVVFRSEGPAMTVGLYGSEPEVLVDVRGGAHISFSPDFRMIADVVGHKVVWITPVSDGEPFVAYGSDDLDIRIDYPVWSNDGRRLLFDRVKPQGGDIWMVDLLPADKAVG